MFRSSCLFVLVLFCVSSGVVGAGEKLGVFVSIPPQAYLVKRIGQEHVDAQVMLRPGDSPETYSPTPRQLGALGGARLYFRIGVPFESAWMDLIRQEYKQIKVVECCSQYINSESAGLDNHFWTSPRNALLLANLIKQQLVESDPVHSDDYEKHYEKLITDLQLLDEEIQLTLSNRRTSYFVISHASLGYYARDYGLVQLSLEENGRELGSKSLGEIVTIARKEDIRTLFVQKQHRTANTGVFAGELGAELVEIDPLHGDYIYNLRKMTSLIAQAAN